MRKNKTIALKLRYQNKSYNEISKILKIPKSTLSDWFSKDKNSQDIKTALTEKARLNTLKRVATFVATNRKRWQQWREEARESARKEFASFSVNPLFIAGIMLYWAEGDSKVNNPCRLTNTDPRMIALYSKFLTQVLNIPRGNLRATIILYPDLEEKQCIDFWATIIGIPQIQFYKTQYITGHHPTARLAQGICMINCGNRQLKEKLLTWIDLLSKSL